MRERSQYGCVRAQQQGRNVAPEYFDKSGDGLLVTQWVRFGFENEGNWASSGGDHLDQRVEVGSKPVRGQRQTHQQSIGVRPPSEDGLERLAVALRNVAGVRHRPRQACCELIVHPLLGHPGRADSP